MSDGCTCEMSNTICYKCSCKIPSKHIRFKHSPNEFTIGYFIQTHEPNEYGFIEDSQRFIPHSLDGPATVYKHTNKTIGMTKVYYIHGNMMSENEFIKYKLNLFLEDVK